MLKIKMIMAALLAIGFASQTFAQDDAPPPPSGKKTVAKTAGANANRKWTEKDDALKTKCNDVCTKTACKNKDKAVECATNCRKVAVFELADCTPGAYAANCGTYASADTKAGNAATAKTDQVCLTLAKANAAIMNKIYENRDKKKGSPEKFTAEERATATDDEKSREARMWDMLKSIDVANDAPGQ